MSGEDHTSESIHLFHVGKMRIKLCKGKTVIAKEYYSSAMQVRILLYPEKIVIFLVLHGEIYNIIIFDDHIE
jgi:hypothetical protein